MLRHSLLIDIIDVEDSVGRRAEVMHFRVKRPRLLGDGRIAFEDGEDEWFGRAGERLQMTDAAHFASELENYVRIGSGKSQ